MVAISLAALFGLLLGSFFNVCIYRVPRDHSVVAPRSFCPECHTPIAARDNIPLLSFFLLGRKCRSCGARISWRYPAVELITAVVFALVTARYGLTLIGLKWLVFESLLTILFWTDWEERLLPDEFTLGGFVAGLVLAFFVNVPSPLFDILLPPAGPFRSVLKSLSAALLLAIPIWFLAFLYTVFRKREGLGLGDVKLLLFLGAFLGLENGIAAMLLASVSGSLLGVFLIARHRKAALSYELPFGSFLCAGAALLPLWKVIA